MMLETLRHDVRFLHEVKSPGQRATSWSLARCALHSPGLLLLETYRLAHHFERPRPEPRRKRLPFLAAKAIVAVARHLSYTAFKSDITPDTRIEAGVVLPDRGHIIVGAQLIGSGTVISDRVTIGMALPNRQKPRIGRNVRIGTRCIIYGGIEIGDGTTLLPRSVLTRNVPANAVLQGNPARPIRPEQMVPEAPLRRPGTAVELPTTLEFKAG